MRFALLVTVNVVAPAGEAGRGKWDGGEEHSESNDRAADLRF